jgi:hypothetical protein
MLRALGASDAGIEDMRLARELADLRWSVEHRSNRDEQEIV